MPPFFVCFWKIIKMVKIVKDGKNSENGCSALADRGLDYVIHFARYRVRYRYRNI